MTSPLRTRPLGLEASSLSCTTCRWVSCNFSAGLLTAQVLAALQDAMNQIGNSDSLRDFQEALEEIRQFENEHEKTNLEWSKKEVDAEIQRVQTESLKAELVRVKSELEQTECLGSSRKLALAS